MSKTCNGCGTEKKKISKSGEGEIALAFAERTTKRLFWVVFALIVALVGSNVFWIWKNAQYETVEEITEEYEADAEDGGNAIINKDGSVTVNG